MPSPATSSRNMSAIRHKILFRNYATKGVNAQQHYIAVDTLEKEGEEGDGQDYKKKHLFIGRIISYPTMAGKEVSAST